MISTIHLSTTHAREIASTQMEYFVPIGNKLMEWNASPRNFHLLQGDMIEVVVDFSGFTPSDFKFV